MATLVELSATEIQSICEIYLCDHRNIEASCSSVNYDNLKVLNYNLENTSAAPAGFLGRHLYLNVELQSRPNCAPRRLSFFLKCAPVDVSSHMQYIEGFGVFKKEIVVYRDLLPKLQQINIGLAPRCFYAKDNTLIFENLAAQGYRMGSGREGLLDFQHLQCLLKTLAAMHASSIVLEKQSGYKIPEAYPAAIVENAYPSNMPEEHVRMRNFKKACDALSEFIKRMPKFADKLDVILENFNAAMRRIFDFVQPSTRYRNCFLHADLWANNMMFQYGKYGAIPLQCRLVDFQLARYAPPVLDVMTALTIPTTRAFRRAHMTELLSDYYRFFCELLRRENLDSDKYLPEAEYYACVEEFRMAGLIESCLFSHLTLLPPQSTQALTQSAAGFADFMDQKRIEICLDAFENDRIYRERLCDMLEDFIDRFVLPSENVEAL